MSEVDPTDDTRLRYIVWHYRYVAARHERRNVVVDTEAEAEFICASEAHSLVLLQRKRDGAAEVVEHIGGWIKPPGTDSRSSARRDEWKAWGRRQRPAQNTRPTPRTTWE